MSATEHSSTDELEGSLSELQESPQPGEDEEMEDLATAAEKKAGHERSGGIKSTKAKTVIGMLFPQLTLYGGSETLSMKKSVLVISILYASHSFSAWGDRMWGFILSLLLAILYPGSLLLPGVYGFLVQLFVAVFGTLVGDWVDSNPRMKVAWISLLIQNSLLVLCSILLALMFQLDWGVCGHEIIFACLVPMVIVLGAGANLATVANTISIEKDWIVVIADKHEDSLAALNSNMRRIDLCCKLLAPAVTGIFLQWTGPFATTLFVASWNIVSFFAELALIWIVYRLVPTLARKKIRKKSSAKEAIKKDEDVEMESPSDELPVTNGNSDPPEGGEEEDDELIENVFDVRERKCGKKAAKVCSKLLTPLVTLKDGWKIYIKQEIALVGFAMASIYLTVLGFSGVTSSYFLTQGLRNDLIGVCQGVGAIFGVLGTIFYPFLRKKFGTVRTGLFGISTQLVVLMFCVAAVFVPSHRVESNATSYYAPDCSSENNGTVYDNTTISIATSIAVHPSTTVHSSMMVGSSVSLLITPTATQQLTFTPNYVTSSSSSGPPYVTSLSSFGPSYVTPSSSFGPSYVTSSSSFEPSYVTPLSSFGPSYVTSLSSFGPSYVTSSSEVRYTTDLPRPTPRLSSQYSPLPTHTPTPSPSNSTSSGSEVSVAVILLLAGVICCRIGLWTFDLAVQQLVQEKVVEEERGVVGGVMNAMNSIMDMLHYVMVIVAPRPEHFGILTLISVAMVMLGWILYGVYVRKSRGHFFHFRDCYKWSKQRLEKRRGGALQQEVGMASGGLVNEGYEEDTMQLLNEDS